MTVSKHAEKRMRQRLGVNKSSVARIASKALELGITHSDTSGKLHRFLDRKALADNRKFKWRIYAEHLWCFSSNDILVTVLPLDNNLKKTLR